MKQKSKAGRYVLPVQTRTWEMVTIRLSTRLLPIHNCMECCHFRDVWKYGAEGDDKTVTPVIVSRTFSCTHPKIAPRAKPPKSVDDFVADKGFPLWCPLKRIEEKC